MWNILYPFVDSNTKKKIIFLSGNIEEKRKKLSEYFDLSLVEEIFGGTSTYKFNPDEYIEILKKEEEIN